MSDDPRTLVKSYHYIDLPGEAPDSKLWPGVNNIIKLRKHRDVVFDIKLKAGATYTLKTDQPESKYGRFYDTTRKLTVARTTFADGTPLHIWVGRRFQGNLILLSGEKEIGRYPIRKMDCTGTCTNDPKDKPAPILIVLHDDKVFAQELRALQESVLLTAKPSAALTTAYEHARNGADLPSAPFDTSRFPARETVAQSQGITVVRHGSSEVLPTVHLFEVHDTKTPDVPREIAEFFVQGDKKYAVDPNNILCRNWLIQQSSGLLAFFQDALKHDEGWLRKFWNRKFYLVKRAGKFVAIFSTGPEDWRILGVLLTGYKKVLPKSSQILTIAGGAGSLASTGGTALGAVKGSVWHGAGMAVAFNIGIDATVWLNDPKQDLYDLFAIVGVDLVKAGLYSLATSLVMSALITGAAVALGTVTIPVVLLAIGTAVVTVFVGYAVDWMFNEIDANKKTSDRLRILTTKLKEVHPRDYGDAYVSADWAQIVDSSSRMELGKQ